MNRYRATRNALAVALAMMIEQDDTLLAASIAHALDLVEARLADPANDTSDKPGFPVHDPVI